MRAEGPPWIESYGFAREEMRASWTLENAEIYG